MMPDGEIIHRCDWCGVSRIETPMHVIERRMRETGSAQKNFKPSDTPETDPTTSPDTPPQGTRPNNKEIA